MTDEQLLMHELDLLAGRIEKASNLRTAAPVISEYAQKLSKEKSINSIIADACKENMELKDRFERIKKKFIRKMTRVRNTIIRYINEQKINDPVIQQHIGILKNFIEDDIGAIFGQYFAIKRILKLLLQLGESKHIAFLKQYAVHNGESLHPIFYQDYTDFEKHLGDLNRIAPTLIWESFRRIFWFNAVYDPKAYEQLKKDVSKAKQPYNSLSLHIRHQSLTQVLSCAEENFGAWEYEISQIKDDIKKIQLHIKRSASVSDVQLEDETIFYYETKNGIQLGYREKLIKISGDCAKLFLKLIENVEGIHVSDLYALMTDRDPEEIFNFTKKQKEKVYNAQKRFNSRIANEFAIPYLIRSDKKGGIFFNQKYVNFIRKSDKNQQSLS